MTKPFDMISPEEKDYISKWIAKNAIVDCSEDGAYTQLSPNVHYSPLDYILRFWNENKETLFKLLGGQLIVSRNIKITANFRDKKEIYEDLFYYKFIYFVKQKIRAGELIETYNPANTWLSERYPNGNKSCSYLDSLLDSRDDCLYNNKLRYETYYIHYEDKKIKFEHDGSPIKALAKLASAMNLNAEFEEFRLAHSRVLDNKIISGKLCLSIHPLDYMTMSDNSYDWDSCMSWYKGGCYRVGTVEMMNSPYVIVAYLDGEKPYNLHLGNNEKWSNKKWRILIVLDDEGSFCVTVKGYPYSHEELSKAALEFIRDLARENLGWEYDDGIFEYDDENSAIPFANGKESTYFETDCMYNDFGRGQVSYMLINSKHPYYDSCFNYSGPSNCMICGSEYEADEHTREIICPDCGIEWDRIIGYCAECGNEILNDDTYILCDEDNQYYCAECSHLVNVCDKCGNSFLAENTKWIFIDYKGYKVNKDKLIDIAESDSMHEYCLERCCFCEDCDRTLEKKYGSYMTKEYTDTSIETIDATSMPKEDLKKLFADFYIRNTLGLANLLANSLKINDPNMVNYWHRRKKLSAMSKEFDEDENLDFLTNESLWF